MSTFTLGSGLRPEERPQDALFPQYVAGLREHARKARREQLVLVGEHNPYGADPRFALYPRPTNAAGGRLVRALGMTEREYLRTFGRRNLLTGEPGDPFRWSAPVARVAARSLVGDYLDDEPDFRLVLLGAKVAAAFGIDFKAHCWAAGLTLRAGDWARLHGGPTPDVPDGRCVVCSRPRADEAHVLGSA